MLNKAYLSLYNLFGLAGWGYILFVVTGLAAEGRLKQLWQEHEWTVKIVQGAAVLEIAHAGLGLVRSPMSRTFIQVFSRLAIVWGAHDPLYKYPFTPFPKPKGCELTLESGPECTEERNQMVIAATLVTWSIAELIRYSFYLFNTIDPKIVPFPIVWLRYTGFIVLYPIGVAGEMISAYLTLPLIRKGMCPSFEGLMTECPAGFETFLYFFLFQYLWGLPLLYTTMLGERKKRLYPKPAPKLQGVVFPLTKKGDRSTTPTAKEIFGAALEAVDKQAAEKVRKEKNWRFGYNKHIVNNLLAAAKSEAAALKIAQAGIDAMYKNFDFIAADGTSLKFEEALKKVGDSISISIRIIIV
jgi:very-long-chain (3R)-3-hydroxyacyl-CoA dehydratase